MVLVQNWSFFQLLFFRQNRAGKCLLRYSETKKLLCRLKKKEDQKVEKLPFFSKTVNQRFWSKNGHFSNFFFSGIIGQQYVSYDIPERKNSF